MKVETEMGRWLSITGSVGDALVGDLLLLQGRLLKEDGENGGGFWNTNSVGGEYLGAELPEILEVVDGHEAGVLLGRGCLYTFVPERDWPAVSEVLKQHGVRLEE